MDNLLFQFNPEFQLKKTPYGGLVFDPQACRTFSINDKAYSFLLDSSTRPVKLTSVVKREDFRIFAIFRKYRVVTPIVSENQSSPTTIENLESFPNTIESVHFLVTEECNKNCRTCYINHKDRQESSLKQVQNIIDKFCQLKVFQVAIGGGEPFLRKDILKILRHIHQKRVIITITTNGSLLNKGILKDIKYMVKSIQLSIFSHIESEHEHLRYPGSFRQTLRNILMIQKYDIPVAINLLVHPYSYMYLFDVLNFIRNLQISRINVIKLKKPSYRLGNAKLDWQEEGYEKLQAILGKFKNKYPEMKLSVDCSLAKIMRRKGLPFLLSKGIVGCSGGRSFLVVRSNGDIYPCCFLNSPQFRIGNFLNGNLANIVQKINSLQGTYPPKFENCSVYEGLDLVRYYANSQ